MFDILSFLHKHTKVRGQPNQKGEVGLQKCPWCGSPKKHEVSFFVNIYKPVFNCFRCGKRGKWTFLVAKISDISLREAEKLVGDILVQKNRRAEESEFAPCEFPVQSPWSIRAKRYLEERGITDKTIQKFGLYYCHVGKYRERIVIPVTFNQKAITFQARSIFPDHPRRYLSPRESPKGKVLYNLDNYREGTVVMVEGPFDVMKLDQYGIFAICPLGKHIRDEQISLLLGRKIHSITLMQDPDALLQIHRLCKRLSLKLSVSVASLVDGDPGEANIATIEGALGVQAPDVASLRWNRFLAWRRAHEKK